MVTNPTILLIGSGCIYILLEEPTKLRIYPLYGRVLSGFDGLGLFYINDAIKITDCAAWQQLHLAALIILKVSLIEIVT